MIDIERAAADERALLAELPLPTIATLTRRHRRRRRRRVASVGLALAVPLVALALAVAPKGDDSSRVSGNGTVDTTTWASPASPTTVEVVTPTTAGFVIPTSTPGTPPAIQSELVPLPVLIEQPGWVVVMPTKMTASSGAYSLAPGDDPLTNAAVAVSWAPVADFDRLSGQMGPSSRPGTVLGRPALVYGSAPAAGGTALLHYGDKALSISTGNDLDARLAALRVVAPDQWLAALGPEVTTPATFGTFVEGGLAGVPRPPGFDPDGLATHGLVIWSLQVTLDTMRELDCGWLDTWVAASAAGDTAGATAAADAVASGAEAPIWRQVQLAGDFPDLRHGLADAMAAINAGATVGWTALHELGAPGPERQLATPDQVRAEADLCGPFPVPPTGL